MGLILAPSESLDSDLSSSFLTDHRHFQSRPHLNPHAKHPRRPFHRSHPKSLTRHDLVASPPPSQGPAPHHLTLYNANLARHRTPRSVDHWTAHSAFLSVRKRNRADILSAETEGRALARAQDVRLPGEERRMPSLERGDAFWDGRACKAKRKREFASRDGSQERTESQQSREEVEELYRMGLLYDDERVRGEGFSLGGLQRERDGVGEVVWNVRYRPVGRRGRALVRRERDNVGFEGLSLALSFTRLREDEALRGWLVGTEGGNTEGEGEGGDEEDADRDIFPIEGIETCAEVAARTSLPTPLPTTRAEVDAARGLPEETIEERVARIKRRVAELTDAEDVHQDVAEDESTPISEVKAEEAANTSDSEIQRRVEHIKNIFASVPLFDYLGHQNDSEVQAVEEQDTSIASVEPATEDTVDQRVIRIKSELGALYQKKIEGQAYYQDLITRFEKLKRTPTQTAQEANTDTDNDDNDDWAFLDLKYILDVPSNDTTTAAPLDTCDVDDTWIMLGSNGS